MDQIRLDRDRIFLAGTTHGSGPGALVASENGGRSWGGPVAFPAPLSGFDAAQGAPTVATGGRNVVVAWSEMRTERTPPWNWRAAVRAAPVDRESGRIGKATTLAEMPGSFYGIGPNREAAIVPSVSLTRSGADAGRAFLAWPRRLGGPLSQWSDVAVSTSDDGGRTWSEPRRVNDDDPEAGNMHYFPSIAADDDGSAVVAWMDTCADPRERLSLMYGARLDGRGRPGTNVRVTSCPSFPEPGDLTSPVGDYFNFDASQGDPVMVFPQIRKEHGDSDVFLLE